MNDLRISIEKYNEYVMERIRLICDFDIWYEQTYGNPFPKEWYRYIKSSKVA